MPPSRSRLYILYISKYVKPLKKKQQHFSPVVCRTYAIPLTHPYQKAKEKLREIKKAEKAAKASSAAASAPGSSSGGGAGGALEPGGGGRPEESGVDSDELDDSDVGGRGGKGKGSEKDSDEDTGSDSDASDYDSDEGGDTEDEDNREFVQKDAEQRDFQASGVLWICVENIAVSVDVCVCVRVLKYT